MYYFYFYILLLEYEIDEWSEFLDDGVRSERCPSLDVQIQTLR